jgi:hypothetical protein
MCPYKIVTKGKIPYKTVFFYVRIKVLIVQKIYMSYFKFYYSLLNLKTIVIFIYFNVTIYIEFELLNY